MDEYKHIETCIGRYIADNYQHAVEVGIGRNTDAAQILSGAGKLLRSTDIRKCRFRKISRLSSMMFFHRTFPGTRGPMLSMRSALPSR